MTKNPRNIFGENPALIFVLVYFAFQTLLVTTVSNGAGLDDAEQLSYIGIIEWGYGGSQPPLYTWLTNAAAAVFGVSLFTLQLVKFSLLASMFVSVYFAVRLLGMSRLVASSAMLGLFLIPQLAWESQRALTHSVASTAACAWTLLAFAWHMKSRSWVSALFLGLAPTASLLGKFNASFFIASLFLAGLSIPAYRAVLLSRKSLLSFAAFAISLAPTALWMLNHSSQVLGRVSKLGIDEAGNALLGRLTGLGDMIYAAVNFSGVALFVFLLAWIFNRKGDAAVPKTEAANDGTRLIGRLIAISVTLVLIGVMFSGATQVKDRWLQPVLFLLPVLLVIWLAQLGVNRKGIRDYGIIGGIAALIVPVVLSYYLIHGSSRKPPIGQLDYAGFYEQLDDQGSFATMLGDGPQIISNLRLLGSGANIVHLETTNPASRIHKPVLVIWRGGREPIQGLTTILDQADVKWAGTDIKVVDIPYRNDPGESETYSYMIIN